MDQQLAKQAHVLVEEYLSREEIKAELLEFLENAFDGEEEVPDDGIRMMINSRESDDPLVEPSLSRVEECCDFSIEALEVAGEEAVAFVLLHRDTVICGKRYFDGGENTPLRLEPDSAELAFTLQLNITIDLTLHEVSGHDIGDDLYWSKGSGWLSTK